MNNLTILYEDNHLIVCIKPAKVPVQTKSFTTPDMVSILKNHLSRAEEPQPYLAVIHRLDQPVEGILVFAKTPFAAKDLNRQLQQDSFSKFYLATVCGIPSPASGTLIDYLVKDGRTNTSRVCTADTPQAKRAELSYQTLEVMPELLQAHLEIHLKTGRHHQIRVQMAHAGWPLAGDNKYNPAFAKKAGNTDISLCAYKLAFRHPKTGKKMEFQM